LGDIVKQIVVDTPVNKVYRYVVDAHNAPRYISSITRIVSGPEGAPAQGDVWRVEANFFGQNHLLNLRLDAMAVDKGVRFLLEGDLEATLVLRMSGSTPSSTTVSLTLDAPSVPTILLNALLGGLLVEDLTRLKRSLETAS
jgi:uncharacterized protein YndB with AHSA1/START domain